MADERQQKEILLKNTAPGAELIFTEDYSKENIDGYDALLYLKQSSWSSITKISGKPVVIGSVIETLKEQMLPRNFARMNAWPGFLQRPLWEVASGDIQMSTSIFKKLGWNIVFVKDEPGLVSARVISMIINEAFFALEENVSSKEDINLAMKLGTNYPYGPFEWEEKMGLENIYLLLNKLSLTDKRYCVAPLLKKKYFETTSLI